MGQRSESEVGVERMGGQFTKGVEDSRTFL